MPHELPGCGGKNPELDIVTQLPGGCGHTEILKPEDFILKADKADGDKKTWTDKDGKVWDKGDLSGQDIKYPNNINHLFEDRDGHLPNTEGNKKRIMDLVKDPNNFSTEDRHGKWWYGEILSDGRQLWAHVINNTITNCGINDVPIECNPDTGYSKSDKPRQK